MSKIFRLEIWAAVQGHVKSGLPEFEELWEEPYFKIKVRLICRELEIKADQIID